MIRYLAYRRFLPEYTGRIKELLDYTCTQLNEKWAAEEASVRDDLEQFNFGVDSLVKIFGEEGSSPQAGFTVVQPCYF